MITFCNMFLTEKCDDRVESVAELDALLKRHHVQVTHINSRGKGWGEEP